MRPRVAVVLSGYGVVHRGAESMLSDLLPRLTDRFELHLFSRSGAGPGGVALPAVPRTVVEPIYLATRFGRKVLDTLYLDPIHIEWTTHLLTSLPRLLRGRYDVIWHETGFFGGAILGAVRRLTGVRLLDYAHSSYPGWEVPFARRRPDLFVTADPGLAATIEARVEGLRVEVVPQGVDCELFCPRSEARRLEVAKPRALIVGALSPEKSPELAIEAIARSGLSAVVAGSGPLAASIDALARERLGSAGYDRLEVDREELPALYNAAEVVVLASPLESGARVVLEAMASGRPVVTADDRIRREMVGDAGVLIAEQTAEAYAAGIRKAVETDWGDRPRQRALEFSVDRQVQRLGDLIEDLARGERR